MQLHQIKSKTPFRKSKRVGRGGKRGTTSGRGTKGQKARAGAKIRPALRDIIKKLPKRRGRGKHGFRPFRAKPAIVKLADCERIFANGEIIDPQSLLKKGLIGKIKGRMPAVKILGGGEIKKKFTLRGALFSFSARSAIESAGGSVSQ